MNVIIGGKERPVGVLEVDSRRRRRLFLLNHEERQGNGSGLRLIEQLALQAEASLSWRRSPGSSLELRFGI